MKAKILWINIMATTVCFMAPGSLAGNLPKADTLSNGSAGHIRGQTESSLDALIRKGRAIQDHRHRFAPSLPNDRPLKSPLGTDVLCKPDRVSASHYKVDSLIDSWSKPVQEGLQVKGVPNPSRAFSSRDEFAEREFRPPVNENLDMFRQTDLSEARKLQSHWPAVELEDNYWKLVELNGEASGMERGQRAPELSMISEEDRLAGFNGCNLFFGDYTLDGDDLALEVHGMTLMACPPCYGGDLEQAFMSALESTTHYMIHGKTLELYSDEELIARFEYEPPWMRESR